MPRAALSTRDSIYIVWKRPGKFPKRVQVGEQSIAWVESEIDAYMEKKIAER
jgi:predicted DNA-binding transcriptional regulator AlpA